MPGKPPLALSAVAIAADGSETTWWSGDKYAYNRPQSLNFRTRIGEGFSDAGATLARRIDQDWNDLELYNDIVFVGDDGQIAYEGRIGATPRTTQGGHSIAVQCAGWMAHAKDRKFTEIYVDRDLSSWVDARSLRGVAIASLAGKWPSIPEVRTDNALQFGWAKNTEVTTLTRGGVVYDAGRELKVAGVYAPWQITSTLGNDLYLYAYPSEADVGADTNGNGTSASLAGASGTFDHSFTTPQQFATLFNYRPGATATAAADHIIRVATVAVFGNHGLTKRGTAPYGFYASDVINDIAARFCPKLNTSGVQGTTLILPHIAFKDRTTPFDAFLLLNGPHGYELAVWENKTLTFRPYDLSDYDWQVRMDQPGVEISPQGDTTDGLANYVVVEFDNVATGQRDQVSPSDDFSLEDTTVDHPANTHGLDVELTVGLTFPTTPEVAIAFGRSYLTEFNRPKNRGQITVTGHILDAAGHWIQPWMVRAGETISVVDHPNDSPRLITETSYDHPSRTMTISTDNGELNMVEAVVDYIRTSLAAANLT